MSYVDPDGHAPCCLTDEDVKTMTKGSGDILTGIAKEAANIWIGMGNVTAGFMGGKQHALFKESNRTQAVAMDVTADVALISAFLPTGKPQIGGVAIADAEETAVIGSSEDASAEATASTARAARREAMRGEGVPTSQQPATQVSPRGGAGRQYQYEVPKPGGGTQTKIVTNQLRDRNHGPHYEAGVPKSPRRTDPGGRLRHSNNKTKVSY
jgi:hypothetical protein